MDEEETTLPYRVMVDDNFDFMDEDERVCVGRFATYEAALDKAKSIVLRSLEKATGDSADALYDHYTSMGDDSFIVADPGHPEPEEKFSTWDFARSEAIKMVRERELDDRIEERSEH